MFQNPPSASRHTGTSCGLASLLQVNRHRPRRLAFGGILLAAFATGPLHADPTVSVRIAPDPIASPIQVFVTVTTEGDAPVPRLKAGDFSVKIDGNPQPLLPENFQLPAAEDPEQQVSVVFAMDYSGSTRSFQEAMEDAALAFIGEMIVGDYAAVLKFNDSVSKNLWIEPPFTRIDGAEGNSVLASGVKRSFSGSGSPVIDAIDEALKLFASTEMLPEGPRAIILTSDGGDNSSDSLGSEIVTEANKQDVAVFGIGVGDTSLNVRNRDITGAELMQELASQTGGLYLEETEDSTIEDLYLQVSNLLANEYLLVFPFDIEECNTYEIDVAIAVEEFEFSKTLEVESRCPSSPGGGSSSGGGGAFGPLGLIAGLSLLALLRRLRAA